MWISTHKAVLLGLPGANEHPEKDESENAFPDLDDVGAGNQENEEEPQIGLKPLAMRSTNPFSPFMATYSI